MLQKVLKNPVILILTAVVLLGGACQAQPLQAGDANRQPQTIRVEGTGEVSLSPSLARISLGVETESDTVQDAVSANNNRVEQVMDALGELGISEEDIQTSQFNIRQQNKREPVLEERSESSPGYVVTNIVRVTVRDLDQLGSVLDEVIQAGANTINNIQFDAENKEAANKQALELAMKDARARAEVIADSAEVSLGKIHAVETFGGGPVYAEERMEAEEAGAAVPISPGQLDIQVRVNVSYQIEYRK